MKDDNSQISTVQSHGFGVGTYDAYKHHSEKQYIQTGDWFISMTFGMALMYVTLQEYNHFYLENISRGMITL